jgi:hypothetical protein
MTPEASAPAALAANAAAAPQPLSLKKVRLSMPCLLVSRRIVFSPG